MGKSNIPRKGSIPRRKPKGLNDLLGGFGTLLTGLVEGLGKTLEGVKNLNLEDLEKLAETQGNQQAKENIKELKKGLEKFGEKGTGIGDLLDGSFNLSKLIDFVTKHGGGGEFTQNFAGGKGMIRGGIRGHILGKKFGGDLPLDRRASQQETKFEVRGTRSKKASKPEKVQSQSEEIRDIELDPIEEDENTFTIRGYMTGVVDKNDIVCEIKDGTVLGIYTQPTARRKYAKEIKLSSPVDKEVNWSYKNGIIEVILKKETV